MFGKTRQGYYKQIKNIEKTALNEELVLNTVREIKRKSKTNRWGARKLKGLVNEALSGTGIRVGRDKLFDLLRANNMLVRKRKRKFFTTDSHHWLRKYENLIMNKKLTGPNQLWVADITYVQDRNDDVYYLYLLTDAYSQKIVGWHISMNLKADSAVKALKPALRDNKGRIDELIHHSDRGVQYCSKKYVKLLKDNEIGISMTKPASPQENAIAERINGILKEEWLYDADFGNMSSARKQIGDMVNIYNNYRPHNSLNNEVPAKIHDMGFSRHETERVIGKMYKYRKRRPTELRTPNSSITLTGNDYSLRSCSPAELRSASSLQNKDLKLENVNQKKLLT